MQQFKNLNTLETEIQENNLTQLTTLIN